MFAARVALLLVVAAAALAAVVPGCAGREPRPIPPPEGLRAELLERARLDQLSRQRALHEGGIGMGDAWDEVVRIDEDNTGRLEEIVDAKGWPLVSEIGRDGAHAAWLIVQHADAEREFQARCLKLMEPLVETGEVAPEDVALLTDRVRAARGDPQLYGTQYLVVERDGKKVLEPVTPIDDPAKLDARRAKMRLGRHADYLRQLEQVFAPMLGK